MSWDKNREIASGIMNSQGDKLRELEKKVVDLEDQVHKLIRAIDVYQARIGTLISTLDLISAITNKELDHEPVRVPMPGAESR